MGWTSPDKDRSQTVDKACNRRNILKGPQTRWRFLLPALAAPANGSHLLLPPLPHARCVWGAVDPGGYFFIHPAPAFQALPTFAPVA